MKSPNIKKDVNFVLKCLTNTNNNTIHFPALLKLIQNFEKKWNDLLGPGIVDFYTNLLNNKYQNELQHCKRNDRPKG